MKDIKVLEHERRAIVNQLSNNLAKQAELRKKSILLKGRLIEVQNEIIKYNSKRI